jgi:histone H3/H4
MYVCIYALCTSHHPLFNFHPNQNPGEAVGTIAKKIGELWSKLSPEEKEKYQSKAREEKVRVALETEALREAGLLIEDSAAGSGGAQGGFVLPVARVRKIVKLDPEVKGLSKEGIQLITKASELFVAALGTNSVQVATLQNRRKIVPDDILQVCETKPNFMFLQEDVRTLIDEQKEEHKSKEKAKEEAKSKANSEANSGVKPLTSFFAPSSVTSNTAE